MKEYIRYQLNKIEMCCEYTHIYKKLYYKLHVNNS